VGLILSVVVVGAFGMRNTQVLESFVRADSTPHDSLRTAIPLPNKI
jgi:hypothetical protein